MNARRHPLALAMLTWLLVTASATGFAADAPDGQACRADAQKLCAGAKPGGGRVMACLKQHEAKLSGDCKAALPALQQCAKEVQTVCGGSGRREMRECLRSHAEKLSPECRGRQP